MVQGKVSRQFSLGVCTGLGNGNEGEGRMRSLVSAVRSVKFIASKAFI
jgi:hypothetical protein